MDNSFLYSKKLLLVDDEPELLKMITAILADEGFQYLITASNMKEGIAAAKAEKPDSMQVFLKNSRWKRKFPKMLKLRS